MLDHPLAWIAASLAAYAIATSLTWAISLEPGRFAMLPGWSRRRRVAAHGPALSLLARVGYFLGIPALAIALRVGRPSHWGLALPPSNWSIGVAAAVTVGTAALLLAGRLWLDRCADRPIALSFAPPNRTIVGEAIFEGLLAEAHWAFFRAGTLAVGLSNTTFAVFLSLGLLALEAWSNPWLRASFDDVHAATRLSLPAALAVMSTVVFLVTGSAPACFVAHVCVALGLASISEGASRALSATATG